VLGRVLRRSGAEDENAWLFMLAEPVLRRFAERVAQDLPNDNLVFKKEEMTFVNNEDANGVGGEGGHLSGVLDGVVAAFGECGELSKDKEFYSSVEPVYHLSFSGKYREELLRFL